MRAILFASAIASAFLLTDPAGATDSDVIRSFEKDGKISFLVANDANAATPVDVVLPAPTGAPHECNGRYHYPAMSLRMHQTGSVTLSMYISSDGHVSNVALATPNRFPMLNDESLACVKTWVYSPARRNGQAVEAQHMVEIVWRIADQPPRTIRAPENRAAQPR